MADVIKHKRRGTGTAGPPTTLASGELAFNEVNGANGVVGYYGLGDNGQGVATTIIAIMGIGAFVALSGNQTIFGTKTFNVSPAVPNLAATDNSTLAANSAFVQAQFPTVSPGTYSKVVVNAKGQVTSGGPLLSSDIPNISPSQITSFDSQVRSNALDKFASPVAPINFNNQYHTGIPDPLVPSGIASKNYVDNAIQGIDGKASVFVATSTALPAYTRSGNVLTGTTNGNLVVDGRALTTTTPIARVLVKNEDAAQGNQGIYDVTNPGSSVAPYVLTRSADFDSWNEIPGAFIFVEDGNSNSDTGWLCLANGGGTLNTTAITFSQFSSAGSLQSGDGLSKNGTVISVLGTTNRIIVSAAGVDIASNYAGQTSIITLGVVATGTWRSTAIELAYGGTGANLSALATGALIKKISATALGAAVDGTDYLSPNSTIDGGTF